ncbi:FAD-dependent oxidoreductase [Chloroflexota bacterium]
MNFDKLFEPITISKMEVKNRFVMAPLSNLFATTNGEVTKRTLDYYAVRARGGVGLVIVEYSYVQPEGKGCIGTMLGCYSDNLVPGLSDLARAIKENGARAALQIAHSGRQTFTEFTETPYIQAPSPIPLPGYPTPKEMSLEEIEETIEAFGKAAQRVKLAGFDAVEVHGAHGYLPWSFVSPITNQRKDKYGGSPENRMRFCIEIVRRIREKVGPDFPLGYRLSGDEYLEGGLTLKETTIFAKELERAGTSWIHASSGTYASVHHTVPPMYWPLNTLVHLAEGMKNAINIPVITIGSHGDPELMAKILTDGKADMIAMGRQLLADPELPNKIKESRLDDIRRCIYCNQGCLDNFHRDWPVTCSINPEVGREVEYAIHLATRTKKVLIIGGGPGGMEAARVAALRGHDVTIFEKSDKLGGLLNVASVPEFKQPLRGLIRYQESQAKKAGVKMELGKEATVDNVKSFAPDAVIVATGAKAIKPSVPDIDKNSVVFAADVIKGDKEVGENVLIVGGGFIGCETALFLAQQSKIVTVAEMMESVALDVDGSTKLALLELLAQNSVTTRVNSMLHEVRDNEAILIDKNQKKEAVKADTIVLAVGYEVDRPLATALEGHIKELYSIGDCAEVRNILGAFHDGAHIGRQI